MSEPISEVAKRYSDETLPSYAGDERRLAEEYCRVVPDLLAACEAARQFSQACDREAPPPFNKTPLAILEAAIAKARGAK